MMHPNEQPPPHEPAPRAYLIVFLSLMVLLGLTIAAAFVDLNRWLPGDNWSIAVAMVIAAMKGILILLYFMHVKFSSRTAVAFAGAGFLWLGILMVLTFSDYLTRNNPPELNFRGEPQFLVESRQEHRTSPPLPSSP